ncbi:MAG TPA: zinc ABC transporter substrate-binding protein [Caldithrix abyssi]|uniref:Zinc ABC transporter substrate-binding protein n=1 Tax=Caldithrix abyssi TaxID=187145 RepID=A0A7V1PUV4_CALAY|nr:zinc ABC transporter substrate-binding protein [Caldithrix abyssi]
MRKPLWTLFLSFLLLQPAMAAKKIYVVTTLSTYADITARVGGDRVEVHAIVRGNQDAHFVRPKPSYAVMLQKADLFVSTGLDLELWAPTVVDRAGNPKIRSGQPGYVAAWDGIKLLDKPTVLSRSEGGLHIYGNPHITTNPLNLKVIAGNIVTGLEKIDPASSAYYRANLKAFRDEIDRRVFGDELVRLMGGTLLTRLANQGGLIDFLQKKSFKGKKMIEYLGGWLKEGMPFRGKTIVAYHKNWVYFQHLFGLRVLDYVEPKPGIPPSPKHVEELIREMRAQKVRVLMAANYFSAEKVHDICAKVGAVPVMVPMGVGGAGGTGDVFSLVDYWVSHLKAAFETVNTKKQESEKR